ncbi:MAG: bifunctional phosphoribosylaminoimidazolecarboxamide formyltransferase/IMP cyclohydrolase [Planctomycetota bacterium]|jgi:phosphoribosylaminoimidazolecarboxamide formyltransferase/IMP cyclohydrolase
MNSTRISRALISVFDKTDIVPFARSLVDEFNVDVVSTGGTATLLREAGASVLPVESVTGFPELMDGRVKTLHPHIHAGILANRGNPEHMSQLGEQGIAPIDMVVVNLYPFRETIARPDCSFASAVEMIDIGGPCMIRAAAKNHEHVVVISAPDQLPLVLEQMRQSGGKVDQDLRRHLAEEAFAHTSRYDHQISRYLSGDNVPVGQSAGTTVRGSAESAARVELRYGENPHQSAFAVHVGGDELDVVRGLADSDTPWSYNNLVDADAAVQLCDELDRELSGRQSVCVFVKHTNACGVGIADEPIEAYRRAYLGDPQAAMGGILACSFAVDESFARVVMETFDRFGRQAGAGGFFAEVWAAAGFPSGIREILSSRKPWGARVRLLDGYAQASQSAAASLALSVIKTISGGELHLQRDTKGLVEQEWQVVTDRTPSDRELRDLRLAWLVGKHTKSNAITICKDGMLLGNGAGQMSRVMSCRIATWLAKENGHEAELAGAVAASDAFFPFRDGPDILADAGVTAIIQPGGSKRDDDTVAACNERGLAMIHTGCRHFRH